MTVGYQRFVYRIQSKIEKMQCKSSVQSSLPFLRANRQHDDFGSG